MFSESHLPLRHTRWIVLVLLFCMGIATASPLVKPKTMVLVYVQAQTPSCWCPWLIAALTRPATRFTNLNRKAIL